MVTRLYKENRKREVITSKGVGPYSGTLKVVYWLESDKKGIMDTQWHDQVIEHTWAKARAKHCEFVKQFMEMDGMNRMDLPWKKYLPPSGQQKQKMRRPLEGQKSSWTHFEQKEAGQRRQGQEQGRRRSDGSGVVYLRSIRGEHCGDFHLEPVHGEWQASVIEFSGGQ